jgi:hypothetical protein
MYGVFQDHGFGMTEEQYEHQVKFLGREPSSYEAFVEKTAQEWLTEK